jgi:hypothetical protein
VNPAIYLRVNLPSSCCLQITGVSHDDGVSTTRTGVLAQVEPATTFPVYESAGDGCIELQKDYGPFDFAEVVDGAGDKRKKEEAEERGRRNRGRSEQSGSSWGGAGAGGSGSGRDSGKNFTCSTSSSIQFPAASQLPVSVLLFPLAILNLLVSLSKPVNSVLLMGALVQ